MSSASLAGLRHFSRCVLVTLGWSSHAPWLQCFALRTTRAARLVGALTAGALTCGCVHPPLLAAASNASSSQQSQHRPAFRTLANTPELGRAEASVKVALCQVLVEADKAANLARVEKAVAEAASQGARLIVLPEIWNGPYSNEFFPKIAEPLGDKGNVATAGALDAPNPDTKLQPSLCLLKDLSRRYGVWIVAGSIAEKGEDGKLYNTSLVMNAAGAVVGKHRKLHLFDIDIPGKITFQESKTLSAGQRPTIVDTPWGKLGVGICYDMRFPEYAQALAREGCVLLCYPGAFNLTTGPAHWELLQRARAVDNQVFVLTCCAARNPSSSYQAWGHSTICGPWGDIIATTEHDPVIVYADLDLARVDQVRAQIPIRTQGRSDIYEHARFL